ncbi:hypothetical protein [Alistipes sp. ZOR0009]|uniref:hypothetical protein n=1 Tax=Alistipes sp. ZOR0009 TaxID=1339253 RepID=UPI0006466ADB|nr:hypothetical protein [Alistipes sp. ZOR0009]
MTAKINHLPFVIYKVLLVAVFFFALVDVFFAFVAFGLDVLVFVLALAGALVLFFFALAGALLFFLALVGARLTVSFFMFFS